MLTLSSVSEAVEDSWTPGRARAVDQLAGDRGIITGVAVDHRDSLSVAMRAKGLPDLDPEGISQLKLRIASVLAPGASVILLDAEYAAAQAVAAGLIPSGTGLAIPLEAQGYGDDREVRVTTFLPRWSPLRARMLGAAGCKLLLPYRADLPSQRNRQDAVARHAVHSCRAAGVALILEPIVYLRARETLDAEQYATLVIEGARRLSRLGPDILKLQYPGSEDACRRLDEACGSAVPWVLLGGGSDPLALERQIEVACRAGASGFIVGRTLFDGALTEREEAGIVALREGSVPMLERFRAAAEALGKPWRERVGEIEMPSLGWWRMEPRCP